MFRRPRLRPKCACSGGSGSAPLVVPYACVTPCLTPRPPPTYLSLPRMRPPTIIRTEQEVKLKLELLEALGDIQLALKLISDEEESGDGRLHPADSQYKALNVDIEHLSPKNKTYKVSGVKREAQKMIGIERKGAGTEVVKFRRFRRH